MLISSARFSGSAVVPTVLDAASGVILTVPDGFPLASAGFSRFGPNLVIDGANGAQVVVTDFFAVAQAPALATPAGAIIGGDLAMRLAGPMAPAQFVQAAATDGGPLPIGELNTVNGVAQVRHADGATETAVKGVAVFEGDVVTTGSQGSVGIVFNDGSTFSVGNSARAVLDQLAYDPTTNTGTSTLSVTNGPFSFVSGEIAKTTPDAMTVKTPVLTIGVRGTTVAGVAAPEGGNNTVSLLNDAGGGTGQIAVKTAAGVQVMSQPNQTVQLTSFNQPPPPPVILSPQQVQQLYGSATQTLPPAQPPLQQRTEPPASPQLRQQQQQMQQRSDAPKTQADQAKAVADAKAAAEAKVKAEAAKTPAEAAKAAADAAKVAADAKAADLAKGAAEAKGIEAAKAADAAVKAAIDAKAAEIAKAVGDAVKVDNAKAGDPLTMMSSQIGAMVTAMATINPLGPGQGVADPLSKTTVEQIAQIVTLVENINDPANLGPQGSQLADQLSQQLAQIQQQVNTVVQGVINQQIANVVAQASGQSTQTYNLTGGSVTVTASNGTNDTIVGSGVADHVTVSGVFGAGDGFADSTVGDGDTLTLSSGPNIFYTQNVESINLSATTDSNAIQIGGMADVTITLSSYSDSITAGSSGLSQIWNLVGWVGTNSNADAFNMGVGTGDQLHLLTAGTHAFSMNGVETVYFDGVGNDVTLASNLAGATTFYGGTGADVLHLANGGNSLTVSSIETLYGGVGTDAVTLAAGGQTIKLYGVEAVTGGAGNDAVTLGAVVSSLGIDLAGGTDSLTFANGTNSASIGNVESVLMTSGGSPNILTFSTSVSGVTVTGTTDGNETLNLATGGNSLTVGAVESIIGGSGVDSVALGSIITNGVIDLAGGSDSLTLANGVNSLTASNVELITGGTGADTLVLGAIVTGAAIDLAGGSDSLTLADGVNSLTATNVEAITGGTGADSVTLGAAVTGATINLLGGSDSLVLANGVNSLTTSNIESITGGNNNDSITISIDGTGGTAVGGGGGTDSVTLGAGAHTLSISNIAAVTGGSGADTVTVTAGGVSFVGGQGADSLTLATSSAVDVISYTNKAVESGSTDVIANFNHTDDSFQFSIAGGYTGFSAGALAFGSSYAGTDTNLDISLDNFISISNATEFANAEAAVYSIATGRGSGALYLTYTNSTTHATTLAYDSNRNDGATGGTAHDVATLNTVNGTVDHTDIVIAT